MSSLVCSHSVVGRHRPDSRPRAAGRSARPCRSSRRRRRYRCSKPDVRRRVSATGVTLDRRPWSRASPARAEGRCSPMGRWCRAARRPRPPASAAPRAGSGRRAARWQVLQRGDERQPYRIASRPPVPPDRRPAGATRASGIGSTQVASGERRGQRRVRRRGAGQVHRAGAALAARRACQTDVRRDAVQPRTQRERPSNRRSCARPDEACPGRRPRPRSRAQHPVAVGRQLGPVLLETLHHVRVASLSDQSSRMTLRDR